MGECWCFGGGRGATEGGGGGAGVCRVGGGGGWDWNTLSVSFHSSEGIVLARHWDGKDHGGKTFSSVVSKEDG